MITIFDTALWVNYIVIIVIVASWRAEDMKESGACNDLTGYA